MAIAAQVLTQSVRYAPLKDFEPIRLTDGSNVAFDASDNVKACTVAAFISDAKAIEKETRIGSGGSGSPPHLLADVSAHAAISRWRILSQSSSPGIPDLRVGRLDGMFIHCLAIQPHPASGRVQPVDSASHARNFCVHRHPTIFLKPHSN